MSKKKQNTKIVKWDIHISVCSNVSFFRSMLSFHFIPRNFPLFLSFLFLSSYSFLFYSFSYYRFTFKLDIILIFRDSSFSLPFPTSLSIKLAHVHLPSWKLARFERASRISGIAIVLTRARCEVSFMIRRNTRKQAFVLRLKCHVDWLRI